MTESEFNDLVDATLLRIEEAIDDSGVDIDYENVSGILTLIFTNASRIIINRQGPLQQIWVAAKAGGFHFDYRDDTGTWHADNGGGELFSSLSRLCTEQAGEQVSLQ
jgi:CyaY protein